MFSYTVSLEISSAEHVCYLHLRTRKILHIQIVMYLCLCRSNLCSLLGTEWIDIWKMGTNGLWSVSTVVSSLPCRYWLKRLQASIIAKHYFSIWAYWRSTELNNRDVNTTGCLSCSIYLTTSTIWCRTHNRAGLQFKCVLTDSTGVYVPYSFRTVV